MTTAVVLIDTPGGSVSLSIHDNNSWDAPGDPHNVLGGVLQGTAGFRPPDATVIDGARPDWFELGGFLLTNIVQGDAGDGVDANGSAIDWSVTTLI